MHLVIPSRRHPRKMAILQWPVRLQVVRPHIGPSHTDNFHVPWATTSMRTQRFESNEEGKETISRIFNSWNKSLMKWEEKRQSYEGRMSIAEYCSLEPFVLSTTLFGHSEFRAVAFLLEYSTEREEESWRAVEAHRISPAMPDLVVVDLVPTYGTLSRRGGKIFFFPSQKVE